MSRLEVRRTTSKKPIRRAAPKRTVAAKRTVVVSSTTPVYVPRITTLLSNIESYCKQRGVKFGPNDSCAKKLRTCHSYISREMRKSNVCNPVCVKHIQNVCAAWRGVTGVPKTLRDGPLSVLRYMRDCVRTDVIGFMGNLEKMITSMYGDFNKLETYFKSEIKKANAQRCQWKVDSSLKTRFTSLHNAISRNKTMWFRHLNTIALHGNPQVKSAVKSLKTQIDNLYKACRRNLTIINRYTRVVKARPGYQTRPLFSPTQMKNFETRWASYQNDFKCWYASAKRYWEQLKAIKNI